MSLSGSVSTLLPGPRRPLRRWLFVIFLALLAAYVMQVAVAALNQTFDHDDFSESLAVKAEELPIIFPLHMATGAMALILVPLTLLLRRRGIWHRISGLVTAIDVTIAGLTAYPVAWTFPVSQWSAAGFTAQATLWLALLAAALVSIARGHVAEHRNAMLLMAAATSGAVFFRFWLAIYAFFGHGHRFVLFYAADAWLAWGLPVALTAWMLKRTGGARLYRR